MSACSTDRPQVGAAAEAAAGRTPVGWNPMETAPLDCTEVLLLIEHPVNPLQDRDRAVSIGAYGVDGGWKLDRTWCFAGWDWGEDRYVRGGGTPVGWLPLPEVP